MVTRSVIHQNSNGNEITSAEQQFKLWAEFLVNKFKSLPDEPTVNLNVDFDVDYQIADITLEEVKLCVKHLKSYKAPGPDTIPVEKFKYSNMACEELYSLIEKVWESENITEDLVMVIMIMLYKNKNKDDRKFFRASGLPNHAYKVFSMVLLMRIVPYV